MSKSADLERFLDRQYLSSLEMERTRQDLCRGGRVILPPGEGMAYQQPKRVRKEEEDNG